MIVLTSLHSKRKEMSLGIWMYARASGMEMIILDASSCRSQLRGDERLRSERLHKPTPFDMDCVLRGSQTCHGMPAADQCCHQLL